MKKIFILSFIAGALCLAVSCNKELQRENSTTEGGDMPLVTETITATISEVDSKVAIDGTSGTVTWHTGDEVAYHISDGDGAWSSAANTEVDGANAAFITSGTRNAFAVYPKSLVHDGSDWRAASVTDYGQSGHALAVTLPDSYTLSEIQDNKTKLPIIAENTGDKWTFKQLCGILRLTVNDIPSGTSYIKVDFNGRKVSGSFNVASPVTPGASVIESTSGTPGDDDYINITGFSGSEGNVTVNIPLPVGAAYKDLIVSAWNGTDVPIMAQVTPFSYTAVRAHGKKVSSALNLGVFSRSDGKHFVFAPGNLIASVSNPGTVTTGGTAFSATAWSFANEQDLYVGGEKQLNGVDTECDLFGWVGSNTTDPYVQDCFGLFTSGNKEYYGYLSGAETLFHDWSEVEISYKGSTYCSGTWKTPTSNYFSNAYNGDRGATVNGVSNANFAKARVSAHSGMLLFPDNYVDESATIKQTTIDNASSGFYETVIDRSDVAAMKGVVFLPAAGRRNTTDISAGDGTYWTATCFNQDGAYYSSFTSGAVTPTNATVRYYGMSVRLVRDLDY